MFPDLNTNPVICMPARNDIIMLRHTRESLIDTEEYSRFIYAIENNFRHSAFYRDYKANIYNEGLDFDQQMRGITAEMADIELHHHLPTLKDAAIVLTEYMVNTYGQVDSMDVIKLLKQCHRENIMGTIMLSKSMHQAFHNDPSAFISIKQLRGDPFEFINHYGRFFTLDIAMRFLMQFKQEQQHDYQTYWPQIPRALQQLHDWTMQGYIQY